MGWTGWSLPFIPFFFLMLAYPQKRLNDIMDLVNITDSLDIWQNGKNIKEYIDTML
jgi:hypothetical protein